MGVVSEEEELDDEEIERRRAMMRDKARRKAMEEVRGVSWEGCRIEVVFTVVCPLGRPGRGGGGGQE